VDQLCDASSLDKAAMAAPLHPSHPDSTDAAGQALEAWRHYLLLIANRELPAEVRQKVGASDIVQDTLAEAHRDLSQFLGQGEDQLRAWLRQILLNNIANARRHYLHTGKRDVAREVALKDASSGEDWRLALARCPVGTPSSEAVRDEEARLLEQALRQLPEHLRQVIVLRHRENKSFAVIGAALGLSAAAARKSWVRGLEKLRRALDQQDGQ
jgi:RNA polymerase sigma-70 factor, ECF subfamily